MPCPFAGPKNFCYSPKFLSKTKILIAQKLNSLNEYHLLVWYKKFGPAQNSLRPVKGRGISKFNSCASTKFFGVALNAIQFLAWPKKFGLAQNILGPVEGQDIGG